MRGYDRPKRPFTRLAMLGLGMALAATAPAYSEDAARQLAERFAEPAGKSTAPAAARRKPAASPTVAAVDERRLLDEIDMLERARAEAEMRRSELMRAREAAEKADGDAGTAARKAERDRLIDAERRAAEQQAEATRKLDEARRGAEAQRQAEEARRVAQQQRQAEEARRVADQQRQAEEARRVAEQQRRAEEARRVAEEQRRAEEARRVAEAQRQAEEARRVAQQQRQAEEARRVAEAQRQAEEARRVAGEQRRAEEARQLAMEAEREAEAERIAETLRQARAARAAERRGAPVFAEQGSSASGRSRDAGETAGPTRLMGGDDRHDPRDRFAGSDLRQATRVTVLLRLEPGSYGIRRHNKTADPLLCSDHGCYVSAGLEEPADLLGKRRALGVRRTLGGRAGACRDTLGCVFRGVELEGYPAMVQPIDMHVLRHDRRQPQLLDGTSDCAIVRDRLSCRRPFRGPDYVLWVVPEAIADAAGPALLERAVEDGLPDGEQAAAQPFR